MSLESSERTTARDAHPRRRHPACRARRNPLTLAGWVARRRDHGGVAFIDLRDASGVVQVVVRDEMLAASGRSRSPQRVLHPGHRRVVDHDPRAMRNPDLPTGEVEVVTART